jgi:hypothetical protein
MYSKGKLIDLGAQSSEFNFYLDSSDKDTFKYQRVTYARGNKLMESMTGNPNTVIVDYVDTVKLVSPDKYEVSRKYVKKLDTKALFDSRVVRYESGQKVENSSYVRCQ